MTDAGSTRSTRGTRGARGARGARAAALRAALSASELDALLVTSLPNIRYLTGFSGSSALLVVTANELLFVSDFRYATQAVDEVGDAARVVIEPTSLWTRLWTLLPSLQVTTLGFESAHITHADVQRLGAPDGGVRWTWRPASNLVEALRERKDANEVALIREAVRVAEYALERTVAQVRTGMRETEIGGILEHELRSAGSEQHPFETIVASGERSALPHARCSAREIRRGDFLLIDFGAVVGGYCSDITRTFSVGPASPEMMELYRVVREANATASGAVRAGMRGRDADALARGYIDRLGLGELFGHSLGHGIGLEIHEGPRLAKTAEAPLPEGAVVTIEPGVYRPGWGGVRIEDDVLLTANGPVLLTGFSRELIELG